MPDSAQTNIIEATLVHNRAFVEGTDKRPRDLSGRPRKHLAVVSCMDTRLTRMLPQVLGLDDGDAVFIKAAGATIVSPYGEVMRSLVVAVAELGVREVMVVGHTDCGTCGMTADDLIEALRAAGVDEKNLAAAQATAPTDRFLTGFSCLEDEVARGVRTIREHPLMPPTVVVRGFTIDVATGALREVTPRAGRAN